MHEFENFCRQGFKVDSIKDRVEAQRKKDLNIESYKNEFMNLTFTGFFDSTGGYFFVSVRRTYATMFFDSFGSLLNFFLQESAPPHTLTWNYCW